MSVFAVRELCGGLIPRLSVLERAKAERASEFALEHIEKSVEVVTKATRHVVGYVRDDAIALKAIRGEIEAVSYHLARTEKVKPTVSFDVFRGNSQ